METRENIIQRRIIFELRSPIAGHTVQGMHISRVRIIHRLVRNEESVIAEQVADVARIHVVPRWQRSDERQQVVT